MDKITYMQFKYKYAKYLFTLIDLAIHYLMIQYFYNLTSLQPHLIKPNVFD